MVYFSLSQPVFDVTHSFKHSLTSKQKVLEATHVVLNIVETLNVTLHEAVQ